MKKERKMKKMVEGLSVLTAVVVVWLAFAGQAGAYCIHNKSDVKIHVTQMENVSFWKPFYADINPGEQACCHWSTKDCNKSGGKTDSVSFNVDYFIDRDTLHRVCEYVKIPACSDLDITGTNGNYRCVAHGTETCN